VVTLKDNIKTMRWWFRQRFFTSLYLQSVVNKVGKMNYEEVLEYLYEHLPYYQRNGPAAYKGSLDNTLALDRLFGHPHTKFRTIHVAGTNGKGSVSHMMASILQKAGFKTGLYTSPHLKDFRERIRVNGEMISESNVIDFVQRFLELNKTHELEPSFFELTVMMAFDFFAAKEVDVAAVWIRPISSNLNFPLSPTSVWITLLYWEIHSARSPSKRQESSSPLFR
jgi:hypothetical protein